MRKEVMMNKSTLRRIFTEANPLKLYTDNPYQDEFDSEIEAILDKISSNSTLPEIHQIVSDVFLKNFGKETSQLAQNDIDVLTEAIFKESNND